MKISKPFVLKALNSNNIDNDTRLRLVKILVTASLLLFVLLYHFTIEDTYNPTSAYILFTIAIIYGAVVLGWKSGVAITFVSAGLIAYFMSAPYFSFRISSPISVIHLIMFVFQGLVSTYIINIMQISLQTEKKIVGDITIAESYYRRIMENSKDAIIVINTKGAILDSNPAAGSMFQYSYKNLITKNIVDLFDASEDKTLWPSESKLSEISGTYFEKKMTTSEGQQIIVEGTVANLYSDIYVLILRDITLKLSEEERIYRTSAYLRAIVESTTDPIAIKDCDLRYILVNGAALENLGAKSISEVIGKKASDFFPSVTSKTIEDSDAQVMETGIGMNVEQELLVGGKKKYLLTNKNPLYNSRGEIDGLIAIGRDITERKKLEERKDEFISVASHELKTPLTSVKGYMQMLERLIKDMDNEKANQYITKANIYVNRLNNLVTDLLDANRMQSGKLVFYLKEFTVSDLINDALSGAKYLSTDHEIIVKNLDNTVLYGDKYRLEQVLTNLLSNAIKYSPDANQVVVDVKKDDNYVTISVQDFGIGIPEDESRNIFEKFYRTGESENISGLGIGLFISKEIVGRHGGKIWFNSKEGKGSTFYFSIPLSKVEVEKSEHAK